MQQRSATGPKKQAIRSHSGRRAQHPHWRHPTKRQLAVAARHTRNKLGASSRTPSKDVSPRTKREKSSPRLQTVERCVSIVIPACNEASTLKRTLPRLKRWKRVQEIVVVANGCGDNTAAVARQAGARVLEFSEKLGHDTGRAVGAAAAQGKYLLFLDGDIIWRRQDLVPFVRALERGADVALNTYPLPASRFFDHPTAAAKRALNMVLRRRDLKASSLTAVPHAIRRSALEKIGIPSLAVPPLAQAKAVLAGMKVVACHYVDVGSRNRWKPRFRTNYQTKDVIIGDHLEAIHHIVQVKGQRGGFSDLYRQRNVVEQVQPGSAATDHSGNLAEQGNETPPPRIAAVVPARNEAKTIRSVLRSLKQVRANPILVVDNGSKDGTRRVAQAHGGAVCSFSQSLGHDVGRSVGALIAGQPQCLLVSDADFAVPPNLLRVFANRVLSQHVDVALNHLSRKLKRSQLRDPVSTMKLFLNIALCRPDLGAASLTAVPHALSQKALETIPAVELAVPPKALVRAVTSGLSVKPACFVNVISRNRYRPKLHARRHGSLLEQMVIGDHVEALALLFARKGPRGGFPQPRKLLVLTAAIQEAQSQVHEENTAPRADQQVPPPPDPLQEPAPGPERAPKSQPVKPPLDLLRLEDPFEDDPFVDAAGEHTAVNRKAF
ncbi:glycosyltransferase family 2 protein [Alicyclobacillus tolerans]|uniref:glycosyltransferase family 2 protein n=1 Tax=Alicyclobacillus tolerans TaxID=90970 RepID=UPI001F30E68B|nr:glycosyltransferase family 2 protein [Alicyclobacillus tolerans]MCF8563267.1 glycosyltransferase family 2 protein [Alicyclobacillus tolerans]